MARWARAFCFSADGICRMKRAWRSVRCGLLACLGVRICSWISVGISSSASFWLTRDWLTPTNFATACWFAAILESSRC